MTNFRDALLAPERFDACGTRALLTAGVLSCATGPAFHELDHFLPARAFSGAGMLVLLPFRHLGGVRAWIVIFAIEMPDEQFRELSPFETAGVIITGPAADFLFTLICAVLWPLAAKPVGIGIAVGTVARSAVWLLNVFPIPALGNDGERLMEFAWKRAS